MPESVVAERRAPKRGPVFSTEQRSRVAPRGSRDSTRDGIQRTIQRLHGITSVTHAIRLDSLGFGSGFVSRGTTSRLASTACTKFDAAKPVFPRMQRASIGTAVAPAARMNSWSAIYSSSKVRANPLPLLPCRAARALSKLV